MSCLSRSAAFAATVLLVACGPVREPITVAFDDAMAAQAKAALAKGTGTVKGSAFMRKASGAFITAGGEWIYLIPRTPYAEERFRKLFGSDRINDGGRAVPPADPRYTELMHKVKAERSGKFAFEDVKAGRYFVSTSLFWYPENYWDARGAMLYDEVVVREGETTEVVVSGK